MMLMMVVPMMMLVIFLDLADMSAGSLISVPDCCECHQTPPEDVVYDDDYDDYILLMISLRPHQYVEKVFASISSTYPGTFVCPLVSLSDFHSVSVSEPFSVKMSLWWLTWWPTQIKVDMVVNKEVDKVADMEVDMVADMEVDKVSDMVAMEEVTLWWSPSPTRSPP